MTSTPCVLEGIEVIMFRTIGGGPSLWESRLPPEMLRLPEDLVRVAVLLDDPGVLRSFRAVLHPALSRPSTPVSPICG
jgi:transposase, IS5 family